MDVAAPGSSPRDVASFCRICAAACGILVTVDGDQVRRVRGDPQHPVSRGYTCAKGRALPSWHHSPRRLDAPRLHGRPASWDRVLDDLAQIMRTAMRERGPDAIGGYLATGLAYDANGWLTTERLLRRIGTRQRYTPVTVDNAPVLRAAELVTGAPLLNPVWDPDDSRLLLLFGTNPVVSHGYGTTLADPVTRVREFRDRGGEVWVLDPRRTETAALADAHLAIRPGTDHLVLGWLVRELLDDGADVGELAHHCDPGDVTRLEHALAPYDIGRVARATDVEAGGLLALLDRVRRAGQVSAMCGTGVTMSRAGVVAEWLRWALLIVTGSVDRAGGMRCNSGWLFPLDGRPPATERPADARGGDAGPERVPVSRPELGRWLGQLPCVALPDEIASGPLRVLVVAGGNPLTAFPDPVRTRRALARLEALAVLDVVESELTELATHVLPVTGQLERADVSMLENVAFANGAQHTHAVVAPGADRRPVWWVVGQLARRLDLDVLGGRDPDACDDDTLVAAAAASSRGGYDALVAAGPHGVHAPVRTGWVHEQVLPAGRWNLAPRELVERLAAMSDPDDDLVLTPRRQVRSMNSARYAAVADAEAASVAIRMHPDEAARRGLTPDAPVTVRSAHGSMDGVLTVDRAVRPGVVSCPHGEELSNVGHLVSPYDDIDPDTGMPRASGVPVTVEPA